MRTFTPPAGTRFYAGVDLHARALFLVILKTVAPTHDRMRVILDPAYYATWLDTMKSVDGSPLRPYPAEAMTATAVSTYVNNAQHQGAECIAAGRGLTVGAVGTGRARVTSGPTFTASGARCSSF
jgi:hypothetical protein